MISKILLLFWYKLRSFTGLCFCITDIVSFFIKLWTNKEWVLVGTVVLWIPLLKLTAFIYMNFGIRMPFGISRKHSKLVLRTVYWITVIATAFNLVSKYRSGYPIDKLSAFTVGNIFLLIMDYKETEDTINKDNRDYQE